MLHKLLLFCYLATLFYTATANPCNINYGGCDEYNGLCWGTGENTHFCSCRAGYVQDDSSFQHTCIDEDECAESPCDENADCINTQGSFECSCHCGYILDYTGQRCLAAEEITDVCQVPASCRHKNPGFASLLGIPLSVPFSTRATADYETDYTRFQQVRRVYPPRFLGCRCERGFAFNPCGFCVDYNECFNNPCRGANSECVNTEGSYHCRCINGYVLGPCRERCYPPGSRIPELCQQSDLESLKQTGFAFRTFVRPIVLPHYRTCPAGTAEGQTTVERHDLDYNGVPDIVLTWVCSTPRNGQQRSKLKFYAEEEAYWGQWSCWTACKATCWGGVQTRVRMCRNGLPGAEGCEGNGSDKRECYTGPKCEFRVRKDAETLTREEINDLMQAMRRYSADMSARGFHNAASAHGWPFQCNNESCCPHGAKMKFITWHRTILLNYEQGLTRYLNDKRLGIPYWNWLRSNRNPPSWALNRFYDGAPNPFANMTVLIDRTGPMRTIQRDRTIFTQALDFAEQIWRQIALEKVRPFIMHEFSESLESSHGGPHVSVCGNGRQTEKCLISLAILDYAAFDPLFMLHHSQVDRLWAVAQKKMADAGEETWTTQTALEVLESESDFGERQMPFGNTTVSPFPIVQAVNTMRDSYYYEELTGIKYDSIGNNGYPPRPGTARSLRPPGGAVLLIGHYFQNDTKNFYVNYYDDTDGPTPCNQMTEDQRLGGALRLGTRRRFRLTIPHLVVLPFPSFLDIDNDILLKACYTENQNCRERCPELRRTNILTMPDPNLVYHMPGTAADIYKFEWSNDKKMPNWYINLDARSQYLYFYGNRTANIRQVRSATEYLTCNSSRSRAIGCSLSTGGGACALPTGVYYLIDSNRGRCRAGLRMIVVSRFEADVSS